MTRAGDAPTERARRRATDATVIPLRRDGRSARRERGRNAVIEAVVDLLDEGHVPPTTAQVTQRAGVSEATLFRYFETVDELQLHATRRFLEAHAGSFAIPHAGQGTLNERIDRFAAARAELWETVSPVVRLGRARSFDHPGMAELLRTSRLALVDQVAQHFASELASLTPARRADIEAAVAALTSFEAWDLQRNDLGRTPTQVRRSWRTALTALIAPAARQPRS
jgi:AcrR family transcriptional regulator